MSGIPRSEYHYQDCVRQLKQYYVEWDPDREPKYFLRKSSQDECRGPGKLCNKFDFNCLGNRRAGSGTWMTGWLGGWVVAWVGGWSINVTFRKIQRDQQT